METNQVETKPTVCPKCGKSVQSDFTRCPYCGAKLGASSNNVIDFKEKAKGFLQSIVRVAKAHKKATIGIVVALVVVIALIPIISAITSPFNSLKANSVSIGYQTAEEVEKQFGKPTDVLTDTYSSLPASCDEVWVYYSDSIDNQIKSINKMLENANSFADLDKADKEYQKLTEKKFKQVVIGISDDKVVFYSLNTQAMYDEEDLFATKDSKELSKCTFNKTMVCRDTTVNDNKITFTAKFTDGSIFLGKVSSGRQVDEENPTVEFSCPWSKLSLTLNIVDHYFNDFCTCKNCGLEDHDLDSDCKCSRCYNTFHNIHGCECINCSYDTHVRNSDCVCTICNQLAHRLNGYCQCINCRQYFHSFDDDFACENCDTAFTVESNGLTCTITDFQGYGDIVIPSTYKGLPVTRIGDRAFRAYGGILDAPGPTSVIISDSVTSIGEHAFYGCSSLTSITIPDSVTSIGKYAFSGCSNLTSITFAENSQLTSIGYGVFDDTAWYNNQSDGLVYAGKVAYKYKGTMPSNTSIVIKEGTLGIGGRAFYDCNNLTSITIPDSVTRIGNYAFYNCSRLTGIIIPDSVMSIGTWALYGCSSLTSITIPFLGHNKDDTNSRFIDIFGDGGPSSLMSVTITGGTSIGNGVFWGCSSLTNINIPDSVTSIGYNAFNGCSSLTNLTIPNSITSIGQNAFEGCSSLTSITFQGTLEQWDAIYKEPCWNWYIGATCTVYCIDGNEKIN
ncbi:MAG: leucine-rich repeat protein [Eubacteriales bacterium]|nr:leucine-rich repeat protein [Eubacteriales bacterium]